MHVQAFTKIFRPALQRENTHVFQTLFLFYQCCGSGSGIRDPVPFWPLDPGSGIGFFRIPDLGSRIPDLGSRIPNPYFWQLRENFLGKKFYNSLKIGPIFFLQHFINNIVQFSEMYDSKKKVWQLIFFHQCLLLLFLDPGSEIRDPGSATLFSIVKCV